MQAPTTQTTTKTDLVAQHRSWKALASKAGLEAEQTIAPSTDQAMLTFVGLYGSADAKRNVYFNPCTPREIRRRLSSEIFA